MAVTLKKKKPGEEDFSFLPDQAKEDTSFLPDQHPANKEEDLSFLPDQSGREEAPPQAQAGVTDQITPPATPPVRPVPSGGGVVTDVGLLHDQDNTVLGHLKSMVRAGLPGPMQPIVDAAGAGIDKLKETYNAATGTNATPPNGEKPEDYSFLPDQQKKDARESMIQAITPGLDPITGALVQTERGKRSAMALASGMAGTAAGVVASVPAAEAYFGKDTIIGQKAQKAATALQKLATDAMPENPDFGDQLASGAGSMALFMVPGTAAGRLVSAVPRMGMLATKLAPAIGAGVSAVLEAATESGTVYQDQVAKGLSRDIAGKSAFRDFWQNVILVGATNHLGIFGEQAGLLKKALLSAPIEGIQEGAQSIIASLSKNEPIDWKGDVLPSAAVGAVLGAGAGPVIESALEEKVPHETLITDKVLGTNGSAYLKTKFPGLYQGINNQTAPVNETELRDHLVRSAAAGEEVILKGGTPEQANQAAIDAFAKAILPAAQEAQAKAQAKAQEPAKAPRESIEDLMKHFDPNPEEVSKPNEHPESTVIEDQPTEYETSHVIPLPDNPIRIRKADIEAEAKYLHARALEDRTSKVSALEEFVKENGGIATYTKDANGNSTELEEYKNIPVRLRGGTSYDEMRQMAMDHGVLPHDAPYSALYDELGTLPERGGIPKVEDFYAEARHNIEYEKLQDRAAKGGVIPTDVAANYSAQQVTNLQSRAKLAAEKVLSSNKIDDRVLVDLVDAINVDPVAFKKGYGEQANPEDFNFKGETRAVNGDRMQAVINLAKGATEQTGRHEAFHAVSNILLDESENNIITKKYGDMEKAADAFGEYRAGKSTGETIVDKVFQKIKEFLEKLGNYLDQSKFTTADELFHGIEHGRFADRALRTQIKDDTVRAQPAPQLTAEEAAAKQGDAQYSALSALKRMIGKTESVRPQLQSPEFKSWFGDSKVVDKNGNPQIVFHGTDKTFSEFDPNRRDLGFHFGISPELSESRIDDRDPMDQIPGTRPEWKRGGAIMPVYLRLENPAIAQHDAGEWSDVASAKSALAGSLPADEMQRIQTIDELRNALQGAGYDGIAYQNQYENYPGMKEGARASFMVFDPSQIKSAYNLGTFDPNSADIRYSAKQKQDPNQLDLFNEKGEATLQSVARDPLIGSQEDEKVGEPIETKAAPEPLTPKQKAKADIADVGQQLWYNRRNFTGKALTWEDVKDLNDTLKVREVSKAKVWTKPNYEELVRDGMHRHAAHILKQIYDAVGIGPARGAATDIELKGYIDDVNKVRAAAFEWIKKLDTGMKSHDADLKAKNMTAGSYDIAHAAGSLLDLIYPAKPGEEGRRGRIMSNPDYLESVRRLGGNRFLRAIQPGWSENRAANKAIEKGWPASQEAWVRQFSIREVPVGGKVYERGQYRVTTQPEFYVVRNASRQIMESGFKSAEEAQAFARNLAGKKKTQVPGFDKPYEQGDKSRVGPERRAEGENVTPQRLMESYGFRGVNYGNWVNNQERQDFTNKAYDALADLSDYLGVPPKALGLNGLLGLAFGAQGRGGRAAAHFVPGVNEINLTKTAGAGALAHEWGHALDHYFAVQANDASAKAGKPYLTHHTDLSAGQLTGLRPEILSAFKEIVDTMKSRVETEAEVKARLDDADKKSSARLESWITALRKRLDKEATPETKEAALKQFDESAEKIRKGDLGDGYVMTSKNTGFSPVVSDVREIFNQATGRLLSMDETKGLSANADHVRYIRSADAQARRHTPQQISTTYYKNAKQGDSDKGGKQYWSSETELFARAFESHVLDGLAEKAQKNNYLTGAQEQGSKIYPQADERSKINHAFNKLIAEIKTKETPKGVAMYSAEPKAPIFYSQLQGVLDKKLPANAMPEMIKNIANGQEIRKEEVEWSGLKEWLADKKGMVSKKDVLEFLKQNQVQVKEVMKGKRAVGEFPADWHIKEVGKNDWVVYDKDGEPQVRGLSENNAREEAIKYADEKNRVGNSTKYAQYVLPGGENYRELLLTLPTTQDISADYKKMDELSLKLQNSGDYDAEELDSIRKEYAQLAKKLRGSDSFKSSHFDEANVLAHVRFNERTDDAGRKVLFLEEIQSDWHQKGRDRGYAHRETTFTPVNLASGNRGPSFASKEEAHAYIKTLPENYRIAVEEAETSHPGVPNAPFKKTWHELVLKRMLRYAAENGFDRIGWTTGEQQADRYDLSRQVEHIAWEKNDDGTYNVNIPTRDDLPTIYKEDLSLDQVKDLVGKDMAAKIEQGVGERKGQKYAPGRDWYVLKGDDLKIGGEGMKGFYDQMIPSFLDKYAKKWGAKSGWSTINDKLVEGGQKVHALDVTPEMRKSVMELGQPLYSAEIRPRYEAEKKPEPGFYEQNRAMQASSYQGLKNDFKNVVRDIQKASDKFLGTISTRLKNIDPSLRRALRWYEFRLANRTMEDLKAVEGFMKKVAKMDRYDRLDFDLARKNGDMNKVSATLTKYNLGSEYYQVRKVLNDIYQRAKEVKFDLGYLENYFPRKLKDAQGFLDHVAQRDDWSILQDAITAKETALQRYLTVEEKAELINSMIRGTRRGLVSLSETGNMKDRVIEKVTPHMNQFYYDSDAALVRYLNEVNAAIENRRFFGKGTVEKKGSNFGESAGQIDFDDSIGMYILDLLNQGKIKPSQEKAVRDMLAARFAPTGPGPITGLFRNISYIDAMGSPISALSQLGDIGFSTYRGGFARTGWNLAKALVGQSEVKRADIGAEKIAQEFSDPVRSYKALEKVFKWIGLDKLDQLGKEVYINTVLNKFRSQVKNPNREFFERLTTVFGDETPQVIKDLESGKITENVKYLLFSELSDVQPISLSEMPEKYLSGGNGRIFYMLKSFALKQIDLFRNEAFQKIQQPGAKNKAEGIRRLLYLVATLATANAGADFLKNLLLNRPTDLSDVLTDNLIRLTGISKYAIYDARRNGIWDAAQKTILPPHKALDAVYRDFANVDFTKTGPYIDNRDPANQKMQGNWWMGKKLETPASIPYLGKFYYWWFGKGADLSDKKRQQMRQQAAVQR